MSHIDLAFGAAVALVVAWPVVWKYASKLRATGPQATSVEAWRQKWTATLITLIDQIEAGGGHFTSKDSAVRLAKELLWEVIGGDGPQPTKPK